MKLLSWIGRQRTRAIAALVVIAILTPPIGSVLKPYLTEAVVGLLVIAFMRIDTAAFRFHLRHPGLVIAASIWTTFVIPVLFALGSLLFDLRHSYPPLFTGLMLHAVASPMMAAPAFASLMGLDATIVLVTLLLSTAMVPLSAPLFAAMFSIDLALSPAALGLKLLAILAGSAVAGLLIRKAMGPERVAGFRDEIDGVNILILFVFVSAVMGDVGVEFLQHPLRMIGLTALAFVVFALLLTITWAVFAITGTGNALAIGLVTSQRNMGLMIVAAGGVVPELTWFYFAAGQFPIYLSPWLLQPLAGLVNRVKADP